MWIEPELTDSNKGVLGAQCLANSTQYLQDFNNKVSVLEANVDSIKRIDCHATAHLDCNVAGAYTTEERLIGRKYISGLYNNASSTSTQLRFDAVSVPYAGVYVVCWRDTYAPDHNTNVGASAYSLGTFTVRGITRVRIGSTSGVWTYDSFQHGSSSSRS